MSISDICNRDAACIKKNESVFQAAQLMRRFHVGDLVVTSEDEGKTVPIAILTDRDIVIEVLAKDINPASILVQDIMSLELSTANENNSMFEVVEKMLNAGVRRLPIVNSNGALVGIITIEDLIEKMAEQLSNIVLVLHKGRQYEKMLRS